MTVNNYSDKDGRCNVVNMSNVKVREALTNLTKAENCE